jgi:Acetyltransferase (GNAT) domain
MQLTKAKANDSLNLIKDLGDGVILRRARETDIEALVDFNSRIHTEGESPDVRVGEWTRDLLSKPHPTFRIDDFVVVEDTRSGAIVSSMNLISQTWTYAGIPFKVGRPELVGTHPDYRNRGYVRAQFDVIHQWSAERGELVQAITGIPYYYRLFGYEMALDLGGGRAGYLPQIQGLGEDQQEPYVIRLAQPADISRIAVLYQQGCQRSLVSCVRDDAQWAYELTGRSPANVNRSVLCAIEAPGGEVIGFLAHPVDMWGTMMVATTYEVQTGISWGAVTPSVIRYLRKYAHAVVSESEQKNEFAGFGFWMGREHPVYQVLGDRLPRVRKPYAWYLRVLDLPGFIRLITPVLDKRLADSPLIGHSGELHITFYSSGLLLKFSEGKLSDVSEWKPTPTGESGEAGFPGLTFLQLLFGYRTLIELQYAFADCWARNEVAQLLLEILFPQQPSSVWGIS